MRFHLYDRVGVKCPILAEHLRIHALMVELTYTHQTKCNSTID